MIILRLREIAEAKEINRHQLSMQTGISYPTIDAWWDDEPVSFGRGVIERLCAALNVEPGDIIKRTVTTDTPT